MPFLPQVSNIVRCPVMVQARLCAMVLSHSVATHFPVSRHSDAANALRLAFVNPAYTSLRISEPVDSPAVAAHARQNLTNRSWKTPWVVSR